MGETMKLYWIKYFKKGTKVQHRLVLALGNHNGKLCCLNADTMDDGDKSILKKRSAYLNRLGVKDQIAAIKEMCPNAMSHYRTLNLDNVVIDKEYDI